MNEQSLYHTLGEISGKLSSLQNNVAERFEATNKRIDEKVGGVAEQVKDLNRVNIEQHKKIVLIEGRVGTLENDKRWISWLASALGLSGGGLSMLIWKMFFGG